MYTRPFQTTHPFLTEVDPRGRVKGSRDPLGIMSMWTRLGRKVVGNLTTVSDSISGFITLLLGHHFIERAREEGCDDALTVFLKWEQLAAHARWIVCGDDDFRGKERVKQHSAAKIRLGTQEGMQILSNQKTYGLWGLYTNPARASGLLEGEQVRLAPAARRLVDSVYMPILASSGVRIDNAITTLLRDPTAALSRQSPLLTAVARVFRPTLGREEREVFRRHLVLGGPANATDGTQAVLADLLETSLADPAWKFTPERLRRLTRNIGKYGEPGVRLTGCLHRITACEEVLGPAAILFDDLLHADGQTLGELANRLRRHWGPKVNHLDISMLETSARELRDPTGDPATGQRWVQLARAWGAGEYAEAYRVLLTQNAAVMHSRASAAPWAELRDDSIIQVNYRDEIRPEIPAGDKLVEVWRHPYFLGALRSVVQTLHGGR